jgi:phospholipid/cholesterol/gamma-HCH transport system ATP-binding protein
MRGVACGTMADPSATVVGGVDWQVAGGDFWVVAGLHGSGKSDFLMMTAGLMLPAAGDYELFGEPLAEFEEDRLRQRLRVGFVFDGGHLFNHLTVAENLALPLRYHQDIGEEELAARVAQWLDAAELLAAADKLPGTLGRSWQKRVGLVRALTLAPELLLLDNPVSGMDSVHTAWWLDFLGRLSAGCELLPDRRPVTLVATADDAGPWRGRARQFARLQDGRLETGI